MVTNIKLQEHNSTSNVYGKLNATTKSTTTAITTKATFTTFY